MQSKTNETADDNNNTDSHRLLTRYSGWFHPHKSWKCILVEYIISWFLGLDKLALACQQIMAATATKDDDEETDSNKDNNSSLENQTAATRTQPRITKKAMELMTLENAKVRHRMRSPAMLDRALTQWSLAATCPIVDYNLYIPNCPGLLKDWGILDDDSSIIALEEEEEHMPKQEKDDILVKLRFRACLLDHDDDSVAATVTTTAAAAMDYDDDGNVIKKNTNHHVIRPTAGSLDLAQLLKQNPNVPVVLHFHGGGLVLGSANDTEGIDLMRGICSSEVILENNRTTADSSSSSCSPPPLESSSSSSKKKNNNNAAIILLDIEYSLAPEHAFPVAIVQGLTVLQYIIMLLQDDDDDKDDDDASRRKIHISGVSAGALLAAVTTLQGMRRFPNRIASSILICPMLDPACQSTSFIRNEMSSWLIPTAFLQWCWQVYLYHHQPHANGNDNINESKNMQSLELTASTDTATTVATNTSLDESDNEHDKTNQTTAAATTTTTRRKEQHTLQTGGTSPSSCCSAWWQQHKNNSKFAPLMSPLWDDFQDLIVNDKNKKNHTISSSSSQDDSSSSSLSLPIMPRFLISTNRGDPLHDDGVALVQKLRAAVVASLGDGRARDNGKNAGTEDKHKDDDNDDAGSSSSIFTAAVQQQVQHLDHDGTHWLGTILDTPSNQELIRACRNLLFDPTTVSS